MSEPWYYQKDDEVIGPVELTELRWLASRASISGATMVRRGEASGWVPASSVAELTGPTTKPRLAESVDKAEWFYTRGRRRLGPVSFNLLKKLASTGRLGPEELCWKEGMEGWQPVEQTFGPLEGGAGASPISAQRPWSIHSIEKPDSWKVGLAALVLLLVSGTGIWVTGRSVWRPANSQSLGLLDAKQPPASQNDAPAAPGLVPENDPVVAATIADPGLAPALEAIRAGQVGRARQLLDKYLAGPLAKNKEAALGLRRDLNRSSSAEEAAKLAGNMNDEELRDHLQDEAGSLAEKLETRDLRPTYQETLMRALRLEKSRRQMVPRDAIAQHPALGSDDRDEEQPREPGPADEKANPAGNDAREPDRQAPAPGRRPPGRRQAPALGGAQGPRGALPRFTEIDELMQSPDKYPGRTIALNGAFKIGTRIGGVKDRNDRSVGLSIPVARSDERTICSGDRGINDHLFLILDESTAAVLNHAFQALDLKPTFKPTYRAILEVTVREIPLAKGSEYAIVIEKLEILGVCNFLQIARHQFEGAFRVLEVTTTDGRVRPGDGPMWVERLGGEDGFVKPVRRRLRDLQRRLATNSRQIVADSVYQRELSNAMRMANNYAAIQAMQIANWQRRISRW